MKQIKIKFRSIFISGISLLMLVQNGYAQAATGFEPSIGTAEDVQNPGEKIASTLNNNADGICYPGVYQIDPEVCNPLGPSEYLTKMAANRQSDAETSSTPQTADPAKPFAPQTVDPELSVVPFQYAKLNLESWESAPLYGSAEDAIAGTNPINQLAAGGIRYVSYNNRVDSNGGHYVRSKNGSWLRASPAAVSTATLGRIFTETPSQYFGWIVEATYPFLKPDYNGGVNESKWYYREDVVPILDVVEVNNTAWYQIGEDEWFDQSHIRVAFFNTTPPEGVEGGRWIELDLLQQVTMVYDNYELVFAVLSATGVEPFYTQPGVFQIYKKIEVENMTGAFETDKSDFYYLEDVPFILYYDELRAFHGAYWRAWYGYEQSHGCINLSIGDAHWIYNWAEIGDYVYVHDPSGKTPTDPSYYGAGGA